MLETATVAFTTLFAIVGPIDNAALFAALTARLSPHERRVIALRGIVVAAVILTLTAFLGELVLARLGISLAALKTAGGILLLLVGIEMVFGRVSGATSTTEEEARDAMGKQDISVFPLATPLIAGPGTMSALMLLMARSQGDWLERVAVLGALAAVLLFSLACLLLATQLLRFLGLTGIHVISRVFGVLLTSLAVQFVFDGIAQSGLLGGESP